MADLCPHCGIELPAIRGAVCPICRGDFTEAPLKPQSDSDRESAVHTCPYCHIALPPQEVANGWCETCGKKLPRAIVARTPVPEQAKPKPAPKGSRKGTGLLILLGILYVIVAQNREFQNRRSQVQVLPGVVASNETAMACVIEIMVRLSSRMTFHRISQARRFARGPWQIESGAASGIFTGGHPASFIVGTDSPC